MKEQSPVNLKAAGLYLLLVFGLGWPAQWVYFTQLGVALDQVTSTQKILFIGLLWIPALAGWFTRRITSEGVASESITGPGKGWFFRFAVQVFLVCGVGIILQIVLGGPGIDWAMRGVIIQFDTSTLQPGVVHMLPALMWSVLLAGGALLGLTLYTLIFVGGELGWRGVLYSSLMGWGPWLAGLISGICWACWCLPILYFNMAFENDLAGLPIFMLRWVVLLAVLSIVAGQIWEGHRRVVHSAAFVGCVYGYGEVWQLLSLGEASSLFGPTGWLAIGLWAVMALVGLTPVPSPLPEDGSPQESA